MMSNALPIKVGWSELCDGRSAEPASNQATINSGDFPAMFDSHVGKINMLLTLITNMLFNIHWLPTWWHHRINIQNVGTFWNHHSIPFYHGQLQLPWVRHHGEGSLIQRRRMNGSSPGPREAEHAWKCCYHLPSMLEKSGGFGPLVSFWMWSEKGCAVSLRMDWENV